MEGKERFSWRKRALSFKYAFKGISTLFASEHNARIHLIIAILVIIAGFILRLSLTEWALIVLCIGGVFMAEAINSALEALADKVSPEKDPLIERAKDLSAAAVLLFVFAAVAVGLIVFIPHIL